MDLGYLGTVQFSWTFLYALLSIIVINFTLSGDNAVLIAMAVRSLPADKRQKGFILGATAAIVLRVGLTFFIARLLQIPFIKLAGGITILWIAVKLFVEGAPSGEEKEAATLFEAVKIMLIADLTMSLDNMLAVAGASEGNFFLLFFGLGLSIPFIIFTSGLLSMLMDRFPIIIYIGAAILGRVAGEMIVTDPAIVTTLHPSPVVTYGFQAFCAVGVIAAGKILLRRIIKAQMESESADGRNKGE